MSTAATLLRRLIGRLGRVAVALVTGGILSLGVALIAALLGYLTFALAGISAGLMFLLLAQTEQRSRQARSPAATCPARAPAVPLQTAGDLSIHIQDTVARQMDDFGPTLEQRVRSLHNRFRQEALQQHAALMQLFARHTPADPVHFSERDPNPVQTLHLVHLIDQHRPARILAIDPGAATTWLTASATESEADLEVLSDSEDTSTVLSGGATARTAPTRVPPVPHALLPWYDLTEVGRGYDLIVINAIGARMRPVLPVLPLLIGHVSDGGQVVALDDDVRIGAAWSAHPGWVVEVGTGFVIARAADAYEVDLGTLSGRD